MIPAITEKLQQKYGGAVASSRIYENEAGKEILEFSVQYPDLKSVGQVTKQARRAAITFNTATLPDDLEARVLVHFEKHL